MEQKMRPLRFVIREQSDYQSLTTVLDNVCRGRLKTFSSVRTAVITGVNQPGTSINNQWPFCKMFQSIDNLLWMRAVIRSPITLRVNRLGICKRMFCKNVNIIYPTQHSTSPNHLQEIFVEKLKMLSLTPKCKVFQQAFMYAETGAQGVWFFFKSSTGE